MSVIAWAGDMATLHANGTTLDNLKQDASGKLYSDTAPGSILAQEGVSLRLSRQDRLAQQVEDFLTCKSPFMRGTLDQIAQASDLLNADPRTVPVLLYKETWSEGGDELIAKLGVNELKDLAGKTVVLQAYGPHVYFAAVALRTAQVPLSSVTFKWVTDITAPDSTHWDPLRAFREDTKAQAAFMISPDGDTATGGFGNIGKDSENSVKGAHLLFSSRSLNTAIADVIIVRRDFFDANRDKIAALVHGLMLGQEGSVALMQTKQPKLAYDSLVHTSAKMLLDDVNATELTEGMWSGAHFDGWRGNVSFFTNPNDLRNLDHLTSEISDAFGPQGLKLLTKPVKFSTADFDYSKLAAGLVGPTTAEVSRFNADVTQRLVRQREAEQAQMRVATRSPDAVKDALPGFAVFFDRDQSVFSPDRYKQDFDRVIDLAAKYGGALIVVEGNAEPTYYIDAKQNPNVPPKYLSQMRQAAKNLSVRRANAVRNALLAYASSRNLQLDAEQFMVSDNGFTKPNVPGCVLDSNGDVTPACKPHDSSEEAASRRVDFQVVPMQVESPTPTNAVSR